MSEDKVQVIHLSLKKFFFRPKTLSNLVYLTFRENNIYDYLISILITYISFNYFNIELI